MKLHPDSLLGRDYQVDLNRFTVVGVDPAKGLRLRTQAEAIWVTFTFWQELCESGLLEDYAPLLPAMKLKTYTRGVAR